MKRAFFILLILLLPGMLLSEDTISLRQDFFRKVRKNPDLAINFLENPDPEIRRYALYLLIRKDPSSFLDKIEKMTRDKDRFIRMTAVSPLPALAKKNKKAFQILADIAAKEKDLEIRQIAVRASWPFHREIRLLRNDPTWDYEVKTIRSIPLKNAQWLFTTDKLQNGHLKKFFSPSYPTASWKKIQMGFWEKQGFPGYDGIAWYRIAFTMPEKIPCNAVEIVFEGVDESAWVWLNGIYLGAHDMGPGGWKIPFAVDCRNEILWGKENILTVRVHDAAFAGGIYKPLRVDILK